jgi:aconitate hydratase
METFQCKSTLDLGPGKKYIIHRIRAIEEKGFATIARLPFSIRVLLENLLRHFDLREEQVVSKENVLTLANWRQNYDTPVDIPYFPTRVVMQDFTGVPAFVDLASMRDAMRDLGKDPQKINPAIPVDLVVDHSVQVDYYGSPLALDRNTAMEYRRNSERYALLKWARQTFDNVRIFPSGAGIVHQVNLEYLSTVVTQKKIGGDIYAFPDTLIGTDSHTTMIDGIGVVGWGVGGIEAEAALLGQPMFIKIPEVIGMKFTGALRPGVTATDLVLTVTERLRRENVVDKFVEYFGPGVKQLTVPDRATVANMAPEYGATMGYFPVDQQVLDYLVKTNRGELTELVEAYTKEQDLFFYGHEIPEYTKVLELDLSTVEPCLAGPTRPQDRIPLRDIKDSFYRTVDQWRLPRHNKASVVMNNELHNIEHGALVLAAITSCTNTSNPSVLIGAGLLAREAVDRGLKVDKYVKTSFAPGSRVVTQYLEQAGLLDSLKQLGFHVVAYGCTTCIGNSGPLHTNLQKGIRDNDLAVAGILSGNRNFEARIHPNIRANYLASPLLVVAFAIAGRIDIDLESEPLANDPDGNPVYLKDIWPAEEEIARLASELVTAELFAEKYNGVMEGDANWRQLTAEAGDTFQWKENSSYIRKVPFFEGMTADPPGTLGIEGARALLVLGDTVTTDHISPAGAIPEEYPAGQYLLRQDTCPDDFNSYGSRRGNHEVMMRGTFANIRLKNKLVSPKEGGWTRMLPDDEEGYIFPVAEAYQKRRIPLLVLAGKEYGTGSSRDWAAKGTLLLGVRAVIAESFERIHRSNLVGMGVLPLQLEEGITFRKLGIKGDEVFSIRGIADLKPGKLLEVRAVGVNEKEIEFSVHARLDTDIEVQYYLQGGILPYVIRQFS